MASASAHVPTALAGRYLTQLCKHFEHRLPVSYEGADGRISFAMGVCTLQAEAGSLALQVTAADEAALAQLQDVVARHLVRFAFREPLTVAWGGPDAATA